MVCQKLDRPHGALQSRAEFRAETRSYPRKIGARRTAITAPFAIRYGLNAACFPN